MTFLVADMHAEVLPFLAQVRAGAEWAALYDFLTKGHAADEDAAREAVLRMQQLDLSAYAAAGRAREAAVRAWRYLPS